MTEWADLPEAIRGIVAGKVGSIEEVEVITEGTVRDLAAVLHTPSGKVFCKGIRADSPLAWTLRNEAKVNRHLPREFVPALRFAVEEEGWLLAGFDHAPGRYPDLSPGSPDLGLIAATLARLAADLTPAPMPVRPLAVRWEGLIDPAFVGGDTVLHADVAPKNFLVDGDIVRVVDWAAPAKGPAWVDTAFMIVRLIEAGHDPKDAEQWAGQVDCWAAAPTDAVTALATSYAALTALRDAEAPEPRKRELADAAARWASHRGLTRSPSPGPVPRTDAGSAGRRRRRRR